MASIMQSVAKPYAAPQATETGSSDNPILRLLHRMGYPAGALYALHHNAKKRIARGGLVPEAIRRSGG